MALVNCKECERQISDSAKVCPHCGVKTIQPIGNMKGCLGVLAILGGLFFCILFLVSAFSPSKPATPLELCKMMIKMDSANIDNVDISDIEGVWNGDKVTYKWTPFTLKLQNKYGTMVGASATCVINEKTKDVESFIPPSLAGILDY